MSATQTLAAPARHELEARRSRFIAQAAHADSPEEAQSWLQAVSDPQATHNCWAWRIGDDYRSTDDGEPGGSAGRPILAAIEGQGLDQVVVVVTRWYGGTNLGVGGLVRAYGGAAAECLRTAERREIVPWREVELHCGFEYASTVHGLLDEFGAHKLAEAFEESGPRLHLRMPDYNIGPLAARLRDVSRGSAHLHRIETPTE